MKICAHCKIEKEITEFGKCIKCKDGLNYSCKSCSREKQKNSYAKNIEKRRAYQKIVREKRKLKNPNYYKEKYQKDVKGYRRRANEKREDKRTRLLNLIHSANKRARNKNLKFDINFDFINNLWEKQNGCCLLTGIPFDLTYGIRKRGIYHMNPFAPSIDKINSNLGYTKDNVRLICNHLNMALWDFGQENFNFLIKNYLKTTKNIEIDI